MILRVFKVLGFLLTAALAFVATSVCIIWLGLGYTASLILYSVNEPILAAIALAIGSAPTAGVLTLGWLWRRYRRSK